MRRYYALFFLIIICSCTPKQGSNACPQFDGRANKVKNRSNAKGFFSHRHLKKSISKHDKVNGNSKEEKIAFFRNNRRKKAFIIHSKKTLVGRHLKTENSLEPHKKGTKKIFTKDKTSPKNTKKVRTMDNTNNRDELTKEEMFKKTKDRKKGVTIGLSLLLMAILGGLSIPALGTTSALIGLVGIFILDLIVSIFVVKYHKKDNPKLAKLSGGLRLLYTAILGLGIGYLFIGNTPMFNHIWGIGLIIFGIHLITLGFLFSNDKGKTWLNRLIKSLLIMAGIGYIIWYIGILIIPNPTHFVKVMEIIFVLPMILGEVFYALWMLIRGGKQIQR